MRIIVKNLPPKISTEKLQSIFTKTTDLFHNKESRFCFIGYADEVSAEEAIKKYNNTYILNNKIIVEELRVDDYKEKREKLDKLLNKSTSKLISIVTYIKSKVIVAMNTPNITDEIHIKKTYKNVVEFHIEEDKTVLVFSDIESSIEAQKIKIFMGRLITYTQHESKETHYNALFFDFTSVINSICESEKVKREDLINLADTDLGARVAILESHLIEQTHRWLKENNIDISIRGKLNKKVLLIKNFDVINKLEGLERGNVKISPSKNLAIVTFRNENDANEAYKKFALKRVKDKAIYCEFLPTKSEKEVEHEVEQESKLEKEKVNCTNEKTKREEKEQKKNSRKIIIKNVPFQADESEIRKILETQVKIKDIRMPQKRSGEKRGFCFVEFENEESVKFVCEYFGKSTHLYGRRLIILPAKE